VRSGKKKETFYSRGDQNAGGGVRGRREKTFGIPFCVGKKEKKSVLGAEGSSFSGTTSLFLEKVGRRGGEEEKTPPSPHRGGGKNKETIKLLDTCKNPFIAPVTKMGGKKDKISPTKRKKEVTLSFLKKKKKSQKPLGWRGGGEGEGQSPLFVKKGRDEGVTRDSKERRLNNRKKGERRPDHCFF